MTEDHGGKNVVDLAEARKRQKTVRVGATSGRRVGEPPGKGAPPAKTKKIWQYVQLIVVLAFIALGMQLCRGSGLGG